MSYEATARVGYEASSDFKRSDPPPEQQPRQYVRLEPWPNGVSLDHVREILTDAGYEVCVISKPTTARHFCDSKLKFRFQQRWVTSGLTDWDNVRKRRNPGTVHGYVCGSPTVLSDAAMLLKQLLKCNGIEVHEAQYTRTDVRDGNANTRAVIFRFHFGRGEGCE